MARLLLIALVITFNSSIACTLRQPLLTLRGGGDMSIIPTPAADLKSKFGPADDVARKAADCLLRARGLGEHLIKAGAEKALLKYHELSLNGFSPGAAMSGGVAYAKALRDLSAKSALWSALKDVLKGTCATWSSEDVAMNAGALLVAIGCGRFSFEFCSGVLEASLGSSPTTSHKLFLLLINVLTVRFAFHLALAQIPRVSRLAWPYLYSGRHNQEQLASQLEEAAEQDNSAGAAGASPSLEETAAMQGEPVVARSPQERLTRRAEELLQQVPATTYPAVQEPAMEPAVSSSATVAMPSTDNAAVLDAVSTSSRTNEAQQGYRQMPASVPAQIYAQQNTFITDTTA